MKHQIHCLKQDWHHFIHFIHFIHNIHYTIFILGRLLCTRHPARALTQNTPPLEECRLSILRQPISQLTRQPTACLQACSSTAQQFFRFPIVLSPLPAFSALSATRSLSLAVPLPAALPAVGGCSLYWQEDCTAAVRRSLAIFLCMAACTAGCLQAGCLLPRRSRPAHARLHLRPHLHRPTSPWPSLLRTTHPRISDGCQGASRHGPAPGTSPASPPVPAPRASQSASQNASQSASESAAHKADNQILYS